MEATRLTPHIEKNLAQEVLGKRLIADEPKKPAVQQWQQAQTLRRRPSAAAEQTR